ncbi:unnamed protein product [Rotaria sordida]|uniref:TRPM SLOG domain-containing protein n=1 Tax=Rotaria sordida TaxID=392033 RepID=A0A814NVQ1_9BILA|nr:unnamed protein product [Rotaria sordida]
MNDKGKRIWEELVKEKVRKGSLVGITCHIYSKSTKGPIDETKKCCCGRLIRSHSFDGEAQTQFATETEFNEMTCVPEETPLTVYGQLGIVGSGARFIRCYVGLQNLFETLIDLVIEDVDSQPDLLISCFGGAKNFAMTDKLEKEFMNGISRAAVTKNVWLLTTGLNQGVSKLIGQSVHRFTLLNKNLSKPTIIGMTSWGTLTEHTQKVLKYQTSEHVDNMDFIQWDEEDSLESLNWNEYNTLDKYHSHFLLLDDGRMNVYLDDRPRSDFVQKMCSKTNCHSITIIIEGGFNTLEVIKNDLKNKRPVVIIHGSGRLANVLGTLLEVSSKKNTLENTDVEQQIALFFPEHERELDEVIMQNIIANIREVLKMEYRNYLNIFKLERDTSLTDTIIKAMDKVQNNSVQQRNLLRLVVSWNYVHRVQNIPKHLEDDQTLYPSLFQQALKENRPVFVDYFLRRYYNPLTTTTYIESKKSLENNGVRFRSYSSIVDSKQKLSEPSIVTKEKLRAACAFKLIIDELYQSLEASSNYWNIPKTLEELDKYYMDLVGSYAKSFYFQQNLSDQLRLNAALIAACIARRLSLFAINLDLRRTFDQQTKDYEEYASACVTACYKHNERLACQLLVRENLLFGDVTCMQIAIASRNIPFINTDCFNTVLTKGWVDQLACNITEPSNSTVNFLVSLLTLGLAAPYLMKYREADTDNGTNQDHSEKNDVTDQRYRSYVVLFNMKHDENLFCWAKIYLIITVSAMLLEDFRQFLADLYTQMVEKQDKSRSWIAFFRAMIYILFYIGIIFHFKSTNRPGLFKVARIILAIDLELWFLFSLRFVSAIRLLGPKLFMIQNMPLFAYPPLSLLAYIGWLINVFVFHGATFRIFKYLRSHPKMENNWTEFENAATYEYARHFVEEHYRFKDKITFSTLQEQIDSLKDENERIRGHLASLN